MTVQTAFRFDPDLVQMMKRRAKLRNQSVNSYVTDLVIKDLNNGTEFLPVSLPETFDADIQQYSGIMRAPEKSELELDPRLAQIWER